MKKLKEIRTNKKISQKEFAAYMNVAQNTVSRWENGDRLMDSDTLLKAANYFGVSVDYLLENTAMPADKIMSRAQIKLMKEFARLNDIGKSEAIKRVSELTQIKNYTINAMPIAAHNDSRIDEKELKLMREDIDEL